jgi:predicted transcriptional regulator
MVELAEIMTADVFTVAPDSPVAQAAAAMVKGRFGSAVVMQGQILVGARCLAGGGIGWRPDAFTSIPVDDT